MDGPNPASSFLPPPIDTYKRLQNTTPPRGQEYLIYTYLLNKEVYNTETRKLDTIFGSFLPLGVYSTKQQAAERIRELMEITGHKTICMQRLCESHLLKLSNDPKDIIDVFPADIEEKLKLEEKIRRENYIEYKKCIQVEKDLLAQQENRLDPEHIEHYKHQCYLAMYNYNRYQKQSAKAKKSLAIVNERKNTLQDHYRRHPEHEQEWLAPYKDQPSRKCLNPEDAVAFEYMEHQDFLLSSSQSGLSS